jgi:hypothetical protein
MIFTVYGEYLPAHLNLDMFPGLAVELSQNLNLRIDRRTRREIEQVGNLTDLCIGGEPVISSLLHLLSLERS